jgi:hypothetical protein
MRQQFACGYEGHLWLYGKKEKETGMRVRWYDRCYGAGQLDCGILSEDKRRGACRTKRLIGFA